MTTEIESRIEFLRAELAATDYLCLKFVDGALTEEEYAPVREKRSAFRMEINKLQESSEN